jgi:hypothetical protein
MLEATNKRRDKKGSAMVWLVFSSFSNVTEGKVSRHMSAVKTPLALLMTWFTNISFLRTSWTWQGSLSFMMKVNCTEGNT